MGSGLFCWKKYVVGPVGAAVVSAVWARWEYMKPKFPSTSLFQAAGTGIESQGRWPEPGCD